MANYPQKQFIGSAQTVINTAVDIAASNFSGAPSATFDNTGNGGSETVAPYAEYAMAMIEMPDWAAAPAAGGVVELWGVLLDTDGTEDDTDAPSGTSQGGARCFGAWPVAAADALQRRTITIEIIGCLKIDFYIKNATSQNMNNDGGTNCVVKVTPVALGITV